MSRPTLLDSTGALERAVYAVLASAPLLAGAPPVGVFDELPEADGVLWPHVQVVAATMVPGNVKTVATQEATVTLRLGSTYSGGRELSALVNAVLTRMGDDAKAALHASLEAEGFGLIWHRPDMVERYRDQAPTGETERYAAVRFRFHVHQLTP